MRDCETLLFAILNSLEVLLPRFEELDSFFAFRKPTLSPKGVLFALEHADYLIEGGLELVQCLLEGVWVLNGVEDGAFGAVG